MSETTNLASALITGGVGAAIGSIGTALVQLISKRGESRAIAADRVSNAAGNLADRLDRMNAALEKQNAQLRTAVIAVSEVMDELIPLVSDDVVRERAHAAMTVARQAMQ